MRLAILEPERRLGSHHCNHVVTVAAEALRRGWQVCLITSEGATTHPAVSRLRQECGTEIQAVCCQRRITFPSRPSTLNLLRYQYEQYRLLGSAHAAVKSFRPDMVYINSLDTRDKALSAFGPPFNGTAVAGMMLAPKFHHRRSGIIGSGARFNSASELAFKRLLTFKSVRALLTIDELLPNYAQTERYRDAAKIHHAPDFAPLRGNTSRTSARAELAIADGSFVVLVYGSISFRKGLDALITAVTREPSLKRVCVLVAGFQDDAVRQYLRRRECNEARGAGQLLELSGVLSEDEEDKAFKASDAVWLGYRRHSGMSGVMFQAGALRLPVIACREGLIGWLSRRHELGEIVDIESTEQVASAIQRLVENPAARARYGANGATLAAKHTAAQFGRAVCDALVACA